MEQNNFEKNVQQKIDELKIPPSDSVWTNIEKRIGKKHKDRKVFFIIFFLTLLLLSGGYWLLNSSKNNQKSRPISNLIKNNSKQTNNEDSSFNKPMISSAPNSEKGNTGSIVAKKYATPKTHQSSVFQDKSVNVRMNKKQKKFSEEVAFKPKEKMMNFFEKKSTGSKTTNNEENEIVLNNTNNLTVKKPDVSEIENKNENLDSINNIQNKNTTDSLSNQLKLEKLIKEIIAKNDSSAKKHPENKRKRHWVFGVTFSGGTSMIGADPLGINNNNNYYVQSSPNNSGSNGGGIPTVFNPSKINNSFAFIGGVFIEKNISAKSKISLGVSYKYFSLKNKIGNRIDPVFVPSQYLFSSNNFYSSSNTQNSYRNNFHFLEIPVSLKFQLNKNKRLPLFWYVGFNISQLISSNALQFQSNSGFYYNDNSFFNKTQLGLNTGISATLFAKQKVPVTIGPYFYYSVSRLAGKGLYDGKHFSYIGIRAEILFPKK